MKTVVAVVVLLSSMSAFACINGTEEVAPASEGVKALFAARNAFSARKYQEAITHADASLKLGVGRNQAKWAVRVKGESLLMLERAKEALPLLDSVKGEFSDEPVFLARLAQAEVQNGLPTGGARLEQLVGDGMMPDATAWFWLARARQARGASASAAEAAKKAAELNPKDARAQALLKDLTSKTKQAPGTM